MTINKTNIYKQVEECLLEDMDGELLLYNPTLATTLHLNGSSAVVWELCNGSNSVADIIEALQEAYPDQATQIEDDIVSVVSDLAEREFLESVSK